MRSLAHPRGRKGFHRGHVQPSYRTHRKPTVGHLPAGCPRRSGSLSPCPTTSILALPLPNQPPPLITTPPPLVVLDVSARSDDAARPVRHAGIRLRHARLPSSAPAPRRATHCLCRVRPLPSHIRSRTRRPEACSLSEHALLPREHGRSPCEHARP